MTQCALHGPDTRRKLREHDCARLENADALKTAIAEDSAQLKRLFHRHVCSAKDLDAPLLAQIFRLAARYELRELNEQRMKGKILGNVFLDYSRGHARLAFNSAWLRHGGSALNFEPSIDEITRKHQFPEELAEMCSNYSDITVVSTEEADTFTQTLDYFRIPVINAGNGADEDPTHAMADLYTLFKWRPDLLRPDVPPEKRLRIGIGGDPSNTRTLRSFLYALAQFPWAVDRIVVFERLPMACTMEQEVYLDGAGLKIETTTALYPRETVMGGIRKLLPELDVVYLHNLRPAPAHMDLVENIASLPPHAMVLNPHIEDDEFARMLNDSPHNGYFAQSRGSVFVRMALFAAILGG